MKLGERSDLVCTLGTDGLQVVSVGEHRGVREEPEDNGSGYLGGGVMVIHVRR